MTEFGGRTALVTGAARGIGAAVVARLRASGARVVGLDLELPPEHTTDSAGVAFVEGDVRDTDAVRAALRLARERFDPVSLLVNNAGVVSRAELGDHDLAEIERVMQTNLTGTFLVTREAAADLAAHSDAAVVMVASIVGWIGGTGLAAYSASKAAVQALARVAALELAPLGVRSNAVAPGIIATRMTLGPDAPDPDEVARVSARIPLSRMGMPDEVAAAIVFLLSPAASYITGTTLVVDGGYSVV